MQVAKYWRNNQLRYRLQGVVQQKIQLSPDVKSSDTHDDKLSELPNPVIKVKVA